MKNQKITLVTLLLFITTLSYCQTVNTVPLKEIKNEYVQITGRHAFAKRFTIELDFGQDIKLLKSGNSEVKDENGKSVELSSMIDALNFMSKNGYEFVQAYTSTLDGLSFHYLMRKKQNTSKEKE